MDVYGIGDDIYNFSKDIEINIGKYDDINDEYDVEEHVEKQLAEHEFIFSGRLEIDYLNEKYGFNLPTDESETLSGYIITQHDTITKMNDVIILGIFEFNILSCVGISGCLTSVNDVSAANS